MSGFIFFQRNFDIIIAKNHCFVSLINSLRNASLKQGNAVYVANLRFCVVKMQRIIELVILFQFFDHRFLYGYADTMPRQVDLVDKRSAVATDVFEFRIILYDYKNNALFSNTSYCLL